MKRHRLRNFLFGFRQLVAFSREHKMLWLVPLVIVLLVAMVLVAVAQSTAPYIYTIF
jgi:hypothetical protein